MNLLYFLFPFILFRNENVEKVEKLETQMEELIVSTPQGIGAERAPLIPVPDGCGWTVRGALLYWKPNLGGTEYIYSNRGGFEKVEGGDEAFIGPIKGKVSRGDYDWNYGFRLGLSRLFEENDWRVGLDYTYFSSQGSQKRNIRSCFIRQINQQLLTEQQETNILMLLKGSSNIGPAVFGTVPSGQLGEIATATFSTKAHSTVDLHYQTLELMLTRESFISRYFALYPSIGLEGLLLDLSQTVRFCGGAPVVPGNIDGRFAFGGLGINTLKVKDVSDFWGVGPKCDVNFQLFCNRRYSLFNRFAFSALYGGFDVKHRESYSGLPKQRIDLFAPMHRLVPTIEYQLGGSYRYLNRDETQEWRFSLAYEARYLWHVNQMLNLNSTYIGPAVFDPLFKDIPPQSQSRYKRYSEDLGIHGLTASIELSF